MLVAQRTALNVALYPVVLVMTLGTVAFLAAAYLADRLMRPTVRPGSIR